MSTPIETNTEELQEILQTVYNLPNAGGGSSKPDLVIGLNVADTKMWEDGTTSDARDLRDMTKDDVSIISGSISAVVEKVKQGLPVRVLLNEVHFYWSTNWNKSVAEATQISLASYTKVYPEEDYEDLMVSFYAVNNPVHYSSRCSIHITFDIDTGAPTNYSCHILE